MQPFICNKCLKIVLPFLLFLQQFKFSLILFSHITERPLNFTQKFSIYLLVISNVFIGFIWASKFLHRHFFMSWHQGCPWVGFVLDPDLTQNFRVSQNRNRNRPKMLVGSAGSGCVRFSGSSVGFGFYLRCRYFGRIRRDLANIWPDPLRSGQITTRSRWISTRSRRISSDLDQISTRFHRISSNIMGFK